MCNRLFDFYDFYSKRKINQYKENLSKHIKDIYEKEFKSIKVVNKNNISVSWAIPKKSHLSIIIPTKDNLNYLEKCINSIKKFKSGCNYEIIIVNNNSQDK